MKPPAFEYHAPGSVDEVLALLSELGDDAKLLAGGQSLVPLLNFRLARPAHLVDLNRLAELAYVREWDAGLAIGAMTRQRTLERDARVRQCTPLLAHAIPLIGHVQIRNRGTIGGSLSHADPAAELPAVLAALDGQLVVRGGTGERVLHARDFFRGYLTTSLKPSDLLMEVRLPGLPPRSGTAFVELSRRHGDFAMVGVAVALTLDEEGRCQQARIALIGVGPAPVRNLDVEESLRGQRPSEDVFREAGRAVAAVIEPESDLHASAEYRRDLAEVLVRRALVAAHRNVVVGSA
ncbi:MAG: xanthine dehydrogenase family protein subunit M [Chloroflexi bacterium]|nr:xanthine dehydrogenase family protein subunit M [Chloroflexota bacterium]